MWLDALRSLQHRRLRCRRGALNGGVRPVAGDSGGDAETLAAPAAAGAIGGALGLSDCGRLEHPRTAAGVCGPVVADRLAAGADSAAALFVLDRATLLFRPDALLGRGAGELVTLVYYGRLERKMATS